MRCLYTAGFLPVAAVHLQPSPCPQPNAPPRGFALVVAMIFLLLMTLLAIGLAAMTSSAMHLSQNQQAAQQAQVSAESGLEYAKTILSSPNQAIPSAPADRMQLLNDELWTFYRGSGISPMLADDILSLPADSQAPISLRQGNAPPVRFRLQIANRIDATGAALLSVRSTGLDPTGKVRRTVAANFVPKGSSIFDYGVMCYGGICQSGGGSILGDPSYAKTMSALTSDIAINMSAGVAVSGTVSTGGVPSSVVKWSGNPSVNGQYSSDATSVTDWFKKGFVQADPPPVPEFDPTAFKTLVPLTDLPSNPGSILTNIRIPPNFNGSLSNKTLNGIIYVESPNQVTFSGAQIHGVIVFALSTNGSFDKLTLSSSKSIGPLPADAAYDSIRDTAGRYCIFAPTANVTASGSFGTQGAPVGSLITHRLAFSGGCQLFVKDASIVVLDKTAATSGAAAACNLSGATAINFTRSAGFTPPTFGISTAYRSYQLDPSSYAEVN